MGQGWATEEEANFLHSYMSKYELCQIKRNYQTFWPSLFSAYLAKFPLIEKIWPNEGKKLETLTEDKDVLYNKRLKAKQEVAISFERLECGLFLTLPKSLKEWFRWRANPRSRNASKAVTKKDLKDIYQKSRTRGQKSYEVFAKLYRETVDPIVEESCRVQGISGKGKLPVWHKTAAAMWRKATQEQIDAVDAYIDDQADRDKDQDEDDEPTGESPETYQQ